MTWLLAWTLATNLALADEAEKKEPWQRTGWGFGGVPALNYNSDEGFGYGLVGTVYRYDGATAPYKTAITMQVFMTTKQVHSHKVVVDAVDVADLPLRIYSWNQLEVYKTYNFCGYGSHADCDPTNAESQADALGLTGDDRDDFVRRFYRYRFIRPNAYLYGRWKLKDLPHKVELMGGWRGAYHIPGDFSESGPYADSLYASIYPNGEQGFISVLQAGVMLDSRNFEPAPTRGYWAEASIRGGGAWIGSKWPYFGYNLTLRDYLPLLWEGRLSLANRLVNDGIVGNDVATQELSVIGGAKHYLAFGGAEAGRGIRQARFIGRFKLIEQPELRWRFVTFPVARVPIGLSLNVFTDIGFVSEDWSGANLSDALATPLVGEGAGLRIAIDENFIVRADVGVSALEDYAPGFYITLDNLY
ncbi:MAG: BamA/TamA family outer membrane protein [Oligoflexia bacterium]|nr:BamA/TamA family outer membrane protein [Oligoflexia bacterium]